MTVSEEAKAWARAKLEELRTVARNFPEVTGDRPETYSPAVLFAAVQNAYEGGSGAERERHAKLVAAARELVDAATVFLQTVDECPKIDHLFESAKRMRAAIAALRALLT